MQIQGPGETGIDGGDDDDDLDGGEGEGGVNTAARHWSDEEKTKLFVWLLGQETDEHFDALKTKKNTCFREVSPIACLFLCFSCLLRPGVSGPSGKRLYITLTCAPCRVPRISLYDEQLEAVLNERLRSIFTGGTNGPHHS